MIELPGEDPKHLFEDIEPDRADELDAAVTEKLPATARYTDPLQDAIEDSWDLLIELDDRMEAREAELDERRSDWQDRVGELEQELEALDQRIDVAEETMETVVPRIEKAMSRLERRIHRMRD